MGGNQAPHDLGQRFIEAWPFCDISSGTHVISMPRWRAIGDLS